ncbi:aminotransferase [Drechmeria coniospora]|uniref:Aminotransferase n=1 Tax=Drechmeria coniospora TaxID=98403 RepID=A0A151GN36_DRECN|nr:aminotransferase [Drechmeria coniospora]KYK58519.1 aminotransferase [Drechmeria coniospora]
MGNTGGLDDIYSSLLARRSSEGRLRRLTVPDPAMVDFSSNDYLSLSTDADIRRAYLSRLRSPSFSLGSGGSRLLDGNTGLAESLEASIAAFHGAPAGLLFNSGFEANVGLFGCCAPRPGDVMVYDELVHASVHDGMRLSRAKRVPFAHNCVRGDARASPNESLDRVLTALAQGEHGTSIRAGGACVFIAVESIYSMDGDAAPLQDIIDCVRERLPRGNGYLIVDEAHSTGWAGARGRGMVSHLGLEDGVWARVHTFGKAMGCAGAIVLCSATTRRYLINYARSLIYTTAMGYPALAAIQTVYEFVESGRAERRRAHLEGLMRHAHGVLASLGARHGVPAEMFRVNRGPPASPIIPLFTTQARRLARHCEGRGFTVRPIVAPTVPPGTDRVRLCLHAGNTVDEVHGLCEAIGDWLRGAWKPEARKTVEAERGQSKL